MFSYNYLPAEKLANLVDKYYSEKNLKDSLNKVRKGTDSFIAAEVGNKLVGFCHVAVKKTKGELLRLYLDTNYIGKGIGKKLLMKGEEFLISRGYKKYFTFVNMHDRVLITAKVRCHIIGSYL